jgi:hypothetical protein
MRYAGNSSNVGSIPGFVLYTMSTEASFDKPIQDQNSMQRESLPQSGLADADDMDGSSGPQIAK